MLAFESLTPEALLKEIAEYLRQLKAPYKAASSELELIAMNLDTAVILPPTSPFRTSLLRTSPASEPKSGILREAAKARGIKMIEVTFIEAGRTEVMTRRQFNERFGKDEGKEILAGCLPHIVAIEQ